jgi:hypothetical protein
VIITYDPLLTAILRRNSLDPLWHSELHLQPKNKRVAFRIQKEFRENRYLFEGIVGKGHSFDLSMNFLPWMELEGR